MNQTNKSLKVIFEGEALDHFEARARREGKTVRDVTEEILKRGYTLLKLYDRLQREGGLLLIEMPRKGLLQKLYLQDPKTYELI